MFTRDKAFYKMFFKLAVTLMLEQAVVLSVNLADNVMLGSYTGDSLAEYALAGVAAANQLQFILQQIVYAASTGMIILGSQYWGKKRLGEIRTLTGIAARTAFVFCAAMFLAVSLLPEQILGIFTPKQEIIQAGTQYLGIVRFSYLVFGVTVVLTGAMRVVERVRIALIVSVISLILNCSINYILIFGRFGAPQMGVRGAAVGTLVARCAELGIMLWYTLCHDKELGLKVKDFAARDRDLTRDYMKVTMPVVLTQALWGLNNAIQTVILGQMNDIAIAAQSISSNLFLLLKVASVGACSAASIIIGKAIGEDRGMATLKQYTRTLQALFVAIGLVLGGIMLALRVPMLSLYRIQPETYELASAYMLIQSVVLVTMSYQMPVNTGIIRGGGDTKFCLILDLVSIWVIVLPLSCLAAFVWNASPVIVIMLLNSDQVFKGFPAFIRVNGYKWVRKLTREQ